VQEGDGAREFAVSLTKCITAARRGRVVAQVGSEGANDPERGGSNQNRQTCDEEAGSAHTPRLGSCERPNECADHPDGDAEEHHRGKEHIRHRERKCSENKVRPEAPVLSPLFDWHSV
jgi:hypothetical protein